jgi:hypothetical protein
VPRPAVLLALGVVVLGLTATVRVTQTTAPEGWITTDAEAVEPPPGAKSGRHLMRWAPDGGDEWTLRCPIGGHEIGEVVPIAYNPSAPREYKALVTDRMWLVSLLAGTTALLLLTGLVTLSMPPEPDTRLARPRRRQAIL